MAGKRQIEARWGVEFWQLVSDFAEQGLCRSDVAKALGYTCWGFYELLWANPNKDPFSDSNIVAAYVRDSGEPLSAAVDRMLKAGFCGREMALAIGYADWTSLSRALVARGIHVELPKAKRKQKARHVSITTGWPSWAKVYEIGGGAIPEQRRKKKCQNK